MDLQLIECTDKDRWNRFAEQSPHGSVFCFTPFLDGLGEDYRLLLVEESGQPLGGVVFLLRDGLPVSADYPIALYQGVLLSPSLCREPPHSRAKHVLQVLAFLLAELEKRYDRISICLHHHFEDLRGFSWFHTHEPQRGRFQIALHYSGLLDLNQVADFERYLHAIRNVRRREYQRCRSGGFQICPSDDLDGFLELYQRTFARQGLRLGPQVLRPLRSASQVALEKKFGECLTCIAPNGAVVSANLFLCDRHCAYYWAGANDPEYRNTGCGTYLMIETIRRWHQKGRQLVDFVGINSPNRGDFKTSFNAIPVRYFSATWERPAACPA